MLREIPYLYRLTDIELLENGSPIKDTAIQGMDEVSSFTSLLLIDSSGSMKIF